MRLPLPCRYLWPLLAFASCLPAAGPAPQADPRDRLQVGRQPDGRIVVPTNQILNPAGVQVTFPGRPVDLALAEGGATLVVMNMKDLVFIDVAKGKVKQTLDIPRDLPLPFNPIAAMKKPIAPDGKGHHVPVGLSVVGLLVQGERVYVSDSSHRAPRARRRPDGRYVWAADIPLIPPKVGGPPMPAGIARHSADELWVCSSRGNAVQLLNLKTGQAEQTVAVGVAPFMPAAARKDRVYVSNWGGDPPREGDPQALSSGTPVRIDPGTGVANRGSVSVLPP